MFSNLTTKLVVFSLSVRTKNLHNIVNTWFQNFYFLNIQGNWSKEGFNIEGNRKIIFIYMNTFFYFPWTQTNPWHCICFTQALTLCFNRKIVKPRLNSTGLKDTSLYTLGSPYILWEMKLWIFNLKLSIQTFSASLSTSLLFFFSKTSVGSFYIFSSFSRVSNFSLYLSLCIRIFLFPFSAFTKQNFLIIFMLWFFSKCNAIYDYVTNPSLN